MVLHKGNLSGPNERPHGNHMNKRGWTNTFNAWAGEGDWQSAPAKAFRVTGIPTCYVINTNGMIVSAGHPMGVRAPEVVNQLLK